MKHVLRILVCAVAVLATWTSTRARAELLVGTATVDITPSEPVALDGQMHLRIAHEVETPVTANVIALEAIKAGKPTDAAVLVSCDLVRITDEVRQRIREAVTAEVDDLDARKIVLFATHTHTAPVTCRGKYPIPAEGVMQVDAYIELLVDRVAGAIVAAWKSRKPGSVTWGLSDAVVAYNRRAVYADGRAQMYGSTSTADFRGLEGYEDHDINTLFFWNSEGKLTGVLVNVSCPTQEVESRSAINADFWHPVRQSLRVRYGKQLCILGSVGAAGDQSPHVMYRKAAVARMTRLRGEDNLEEIARRIVRAVEETYEAVKNDRHADVELLHRVETLALPMRIVTDGEYARIKATVDAMKERMKADPKIVPRIYRRMKWHENALDRYRQQQKDRHPKLQTEVHVLRIGDVAICTNRFELFTEFGIRIKARSKALQTIVIQLAGPGTYLPTERAVRGGHYSAEVESNLVGPEGGDILVDRTVEWINAMWSEKQ